MIVLFFLMALAGEPRSAKSHPGFTLVKVEGGEMVPFGPKEVSSAKVPKRGKKIAKLTVFVASFESMDKQVTVGDFRLFLEDHPRWRKANNSPLFTDDSYLKNLDSKEANSRQPMTNVSWFAAKAYCESLGLRLPTTNEWEWMAAASEKKKMATTETDFLERILAWYGEPQGGNLKPVGSLYKNIYGIWDLHGNVWEWVSDFNSNFITGESREDSALNKDMFCGAGGEGGGDKGNYAAFMRYAFRSSLKGHSSTSHLGFRCVRSL